MRFHVKSPINKTLDFWSLGGSVEINYVLDEFGLSHRNEFEIYSTPEVVNALASLILLVSGYCERVCVMLSVFKYNGCICLEEPWEGRYLGLISDYDIRPRSSSWHKPSGILRGTFSSFSLMNSHSSLDICLFLFSF